MARISSLCVYCGSRNGVKSRFRQTAEALGRGMAERGIRLVYGGGRVGLMGAVADAVMGNGGDAIGIIPGHLHDMEVAHTGLTQLHVVTTMHERKQKMFDLSDGFIVMPGGIGTLDETFEILSWRHLRLHDRPVILFDDGDYWQPFLALFDAIVRDGFASDASYDLFTPVKTVAGLFSALEAAPEPAIRADPKLL